MRARVEYLSTPTNSASIEIWRESGRMRMHSVLSYRIVWSISLRAHLVLYDTCIEPMSMCHSLQIPIGSEEIYDRSFSLESVYLPSQSPSVKCILRYKIFFSLDHPWFHQSVLVRSRMLSRRSDTTVSMHSFTRSNHNRYSSRVRLLIFEKIRILRPPLHHIFSLHEMKRRCDSKEM